MYLMWPVFSADSVYDKMKDDKSTECVCVYQHQDLFNNDLNH